MKRFFSRTRWRENLSSGEKRAAGKRSQHTLASSPTRPATIRRYRIPPKNAHPRVSLSMHPWHKAPGLFVHKALLSFFAARSARQQHDRRCRHERRPRCRTPTRRFQARFIGAGPVLLYTNVVSGGGIATQGRGLTRVGRQCRGALRGGFLRAAVRDVGECDKR